MSRTVEKTSRHLSIKWNGTVIADTTDGYAVTEGSRPPAYYFPPSSINVPLTKTSQSSTCPWKGEAAYWNVQNPANASEVAENRIWSYPSPKEAAEPIKDYLSFYNGPWENYVDGELVKA